MEDDSKTFLNSNATTGDQFFHSLPFPFYPSPLNNQKKGYVKGRLGAWQHTDLGGVAGAVDGCATLGEQPGPSSLEKEGKNIQKLFDSSQAGVTHPASCCFPSWWSVKALEGLVEAEWRRGQAGRR